MDNYKNILNWTVNYLKTKNKILFLTTSNRWSLEKWSEMPKSTMLAYKIQELVWKDKVTIINVPKLNIYTCEWNISTKRWNTCWERKALLNDDEKNPSGYHRCWASINNPDDELWKISSEIFKSDCVMFFGSVRWWQMNSIYQKLIERLCWIENRHSTLWESNILNKIDAWIIIINQNWKWQEVLETQKKVLDFYWFNLVDDLSWNWQYSNDLDDERNETYIKAYIDFEKTFLL